MIKEKTIYKWIDTPENMNVTQPFMKVRFISASDGFVKVQLEGGKVITVDQQNCHDYSNAKDIDDMCEMSVLNEPQILNNIKVRFRKRQIFTLIGSTLLVVNPYETINQLFSPNVLQNYIQIALTGQFDKAKPHIYFLAGKSYSDLKKSNKKQTIIISGQSGAGKTQSTKFCLQLLTSLSHSNKNSIQDKILSCNPILQAFGNSKTVRNDNSSRFGKYVQIYFDQSKNIMGAIIKSYLLQKSRVVQVQKEERNYHCFYALIRGKFKNLMEPKNYTYLNKSNCFQIKNLKDDQNYDSICVAMRTVGFSEGQIQRIWQILRCILQIGNLQIDDSEHQKDESVSCSIKNKDILNLISKILGKKVEDVEKYLLYEKRKFLKQYLLTPYNSPACRSNMDSLSKQLYSKTFDFILGKINQKLKPELTSLTDPLSPTINILDIFGFQNFEKNSFEQLCINYTNEKLLNLYNKYIFEKQLEILKEDGLQKNLSSISPPNNQTILEIIHSKKVSIFSIVNDLTPHAQFKDTDILSSIKKQLNSTKIQYSKSVPNSFIIKHSQCSVQYRIQGFKTKNKDKIKEEILLLTQKLFSSTQKPVKSTVPAYSVHPSNAHNKQSKTLLSKFTSQIQLLMSELETSNVHFVRCLKPNNEKKSQIVDQKYLLNQIRYLGVFQTIRIRNSVFPCRKTYEEFRKDFSQLFSRNITVEELLRKFDKKQLDFILGKNRVYISPFLEKNLHDMIAKVKAIKIECGKRILKQYKVFKFRKTVLAHLKTLRRKVVLLRKYSSKNIQVNLKIVMQKLFKNCIQSRRKEIVQKQLKLKVQKQNSDKTRTQNLKKRQQLIKQRLPKFTQLTQRYLLKSKFMLFLKQLKTSSLNLEQKVTQDKNQNKLQLIKAEQLQKTKVKDHQRQKAKQQQSKNSKDVQMSKVILKSQGQKQNQIQKQNVDYRASYESVTTVVEQNQQPYYRQGKLSPSNKIKKDRKPQENKIFSFPKEFVNYNSVVRSEETQTVLFRYNLKIDLFDAVQGKKKLLKLRQIVKNQTQIEQNKELSDSFYVNFKSTDIDKATYNKIVSFDQEQFCEKYLRKRSKLVGKSKNFSEIFIAKRRPLQKSLTKLQKEHEEHALKIFKQILKIYHEGNQQFILKVVEIFLSLIVETPQQIVNEVFLQLLKQVNTDKEDQGIKTYKLILAFLHFFRPDAEFLEAGLYIMFQKLECNIYTPKQQSYLRLVFYKTYNKMIKLMNTKYIPSKYQLYCLICKKLFPFHFYLAMGNCVEYNVESNQTFADIKSYIIDRFGINKQRINSKYFAFFQIVTFEQGQMEQIPISDEDLVWDVKSYWQIAISRYEEHKITPPKFYFLLKLKFPFQLHSFDYQGIELIYAECFFDYFTGKIRVPQSYLMQIAYLIVKVKQLSIQSLTKNYIYGIFPLWVIRKYGDQTLLNSLRQYYIQNSENQKNKLQDRDAGYLRKFNLIRILEKFPLAMSIAIPPDSDLLADSSLLYYLKPRRLYVVQKQNMQILEQYQLKKMISWEVDEEKLCFQFRQEGTLKTKTHIFYTQYAQLFSDYLGQIGELMKNNGK